MFRLGANEDHFMLFDNLSKTGVLRQEAIARMDRIRARDFSSRDDRGDVEVTVLGGRRPNADGLVRHAHMHCIGVGRRMHRDCLNSHFMRRTVNAQRNLATIGDQQFLNRHAKHSSDRQP